jgi:hypothetical protein
MTPHDLQFITRLLTRELTMIGGEREQAQKLLNDIRGQSRVHPIPYQIQRAHLAEPSPPRSGVGEQVGGFDVWDTDTYIDMGNPKKVIASNARRAVAVFLRGHGYSFISISDIMGQSITCIKMFCEPSNRDRCAEALEKLTEWMK